ncbi:hypothetical protein D3C80_1540260 [compost metagenome]
MHPAQATQRFQVDRGIANRQVATFHQRIAELASQVQMFKIAFIEAPRRQQHHQGCLIATRRLPGQGFLERAEKSSEMLHLQITVQLGKRPGHDGAVFQRITCTGRRLRAVRGHPPTSIRCARQIHGIQMQKGPVRRFYTLTGPEEVVVPEHQLGG